MALEEEEKTDAHNWDFDEKTFEYACHNLKKNVMRLNLKYEYLKFKIICFIILSAER